MKKINIVFDDNYENIDILSVPNNIAESIEQVVREFNVWLSIPENSRRFLVNYADEIEVLDINTEEFIWWLNNVRIVGIEKATIVEQHTSFVPTYPIAEF